MMRKSLNLLYKISGAGAALSLVMIVLIIFSQVTFNMIDYVAHALFDKRFGLLIPSYAQFSGYALGFATFLSLAMALRHNSHIRVTLLEVRLQATVRRWTHTLVALLGVMVALLISYSLIELMIDSWRWNSTATGLVRFPLWIPQTGLAVGSVVFSIACIDTFIEMLRYGRSEALVTIDPADVGEMSKAGGSND
ncbi:MAG: TRAP transporter small permease [Alcaligenaceae bacterium]|nr:TRAP transporter small permease [Alcaligenaceae bacterium]